MTNSTNPIAIGVREMEQGDDLNTWGDPNLMDNQTLIVRMIFDWNTVTLTGDKTVSETNYSTANETEYQGILLTGSLTSAATYTIPSRKRSQIYKNETGQTVTVKTAAGSGVAIPNGYSCILRCDGTDVKSEPLLVNGALRISGILSGVTAGVSGTDAVNKTQLDAAIAAASVVATTGTVKVDSLANAAFLIDALTATGSRVSLVDDGDSLDIDSSQLDTDVDEIESRQAAIAGVLDATLTTGTTALTNNRRTRISGAATGTLPTMAAGDFVIVEFTVSGGVVATVGRNSQTIDGASEDDTYTGDGGSGPIILYSCVSAGVVTSTLIGGTP